MPLFFWKSAFLDEPISVKVGYHSPQRNQQTYLKMTKENKSYSETESRVSW